jgi:hypothetical protein
MQLYALSVHITIRTVNTYCNAAIRTFSTYYDAVRCVFMLVCVCFCVCVCGVCVWCACVRVCLCVCGVCLCVYLCLCACVCVCVLCVCVCVCVCVYVCQCTVSCVAINEPRSTAHAAMYYVRPCIWPVQFSAQSVGTRHYLCDRTAVRK